MFTNVCISVELSWKSITAETSVRSIASEGIKVDSGIDVNLLHGRLKRTLVVLKLAPSYWVWQ